MKPFNKILLRVLNGAFIFTLVVIPAPPVFAQEARSLTIRDGNVYIDGDLVPPGELPESLDLEGVDLRFQFSGENEPMVTINGEMYVLEDDGLRSAGEEVVSVEVDPESNGEAPIIVRFRNEDGPPDVRRYTMEGMLKMELPPQAYTAYLDSVDIEGVLARVEAVQDHVKTINLEKFEVQAEAMQEQMERANARAKQAQVALRLAGRLPAQELEAYFGRIQDHHGDLFGQLQNEWRLEAKSRRLARQAREAEDDERREELEQELREVLEEAFELKLENRRREVEALEEQLEELREELQDSRQEREDIIDARMESLLEWW